MKELKKSGYGKLSFSGCKRTEKIWKIDTNVP
jgi:hypothetical protein